MTAVEDNPYASEARYHDLYPEMGTDEISTEPYYSEAVSYTHLTLPTIYSV